MTGSGRTTSINYLYEYLYEYRLFPSFLPPRNTSPLTCHVGLSLGRLMSLERVCTSHAHRHDTCFVCGRAQAPPALGFIHNFSHNPLTATITKKRAISSVLFVSIGACLIAGKLRL